MCDFFVWLLRLPDNGMFPVFVAFIVALLGNCNVGPLWEYFMYVITNWSSVCQHLLDAPLPEFAIIVACWGGFTLELHNNSDVKYILFYTILGLLVVTNPICQVQLRSLPNILLQKTAFFLWPSDEVLQSVYE